MRPASLFVAGVAFLALTAVTTARVAPSHSFVTASAREYFLDFRARDGGVFGHSFVYYGRVDRHGRVQEKNYAGLYPRKGWASPGLALLLFPGHVSTVPEDPDKDVVAVYRVWLNAAGYAHLKKVVRRLQAADHWWHPAFFNCNDFVAEVALEMGLHPAPGITTPLGFVHALRQLNTR